MCSKTHDFEKPIFPHFAVTIPFATWKRSKQCSKTVEKREIDEHPRKNLATAKDKSHKIQEYIGKRLIQLPGK